MLGFKAYSYGYFRCLRMGAVLLLACFALTACVAQKPVVSKAPAPTAPAPRVEKKQPVKKPPAQRTKVPESGGYVGITLAIAAFDNNTPVGGEDVNFLSDWLHARLSQILGEQPTIKLVERQKIENVLAELDLGSSQLVDKRSSLKLGRLLRADYFMFGNYFVLQGQVYCTARLVDAKSGKIVKAEEVLAASANISTLTEQITSAMADGLGVKVQQNRQRFGKGESFKVAKMYTQGEKLLKAGKTDAALEQFTAILKIDSTNPWARQRIKEILSQ